MKLYLLNQFNDKDDVYIIGDFTMGNKIKLHNYIETLISINIKAVYKFQYYVNDELTYCKNKPYLIHTDGKIYNYIVIIYDEYKHRYQCCNDYLKKAIDMGDTESIYQMARNYYKNNDIPNTIYYYEMAIRKFDCKSIVKHAKLINKLNIDKNVISNLISVVTFRSQYIDALQYLLWEYYDINPTLSNVYCSNMIKIFNTESLRPKQYTRIISSFGRIFKIYVSCHKINYAVNIVNNIDNKFTEIPVICKELYGNYLRTFYSSLFYYYINSNPELANTYKDSEEKYNEYIIMMLY